MRKDWFVSASRPAIINRAIPVLLLCALALLLSACQPAAPNTPAPQAHAASTPAPLPAKFYAGLGKPLSARPPSAYLPFVTVRFTSTTAYEQAVKLVIGLGLRPLYPCAGQGLRAGTPWASLDERWIYDLKPASNVLWVDGTARPADQPYYNTLPSDPLAAPDWLARLAAAPEVREIDAGSWHCPLLGGSKTAQFLGPQQTITYARVTFTGISYEQAVVEVSGLGYRLANPCYETASPHPAWRPMGQVASFATTGSLVLAVTEANSTQWQAQTRQLQGFVSLTAPYSVSC